MSLQVFLVNSCCSFTFTACVLGRFGFRTSTDILTILVDNVTCTKMASVNILVGVFLEILVGFAVGGYFGGCVCGKIGFAVGGCFGGIMT